jgi:hypothetical protein
MDGRIPTIRSSALVATALLQDIGADPIRVTIDLDWTGATAEVSTNEGEAVSMPVTVTEDGKRILAIERLPLPWPMPGGRQGALADGWRAASMCQFIFRMSRPPELGVVLVQETPERGASNQLSISAAQLETGFNLATAEPLRSLAGVTRLFGLTVTKNRTWHTVWRRLRLAAPEEPELADAHRQLIDAWMMYVAGYEEAIANYPKTFNATFVLTAATEPEQLPTSRPSRVSTRPSSRTPRPATQPAARPSSPVSRRPATRPMTRPAARPSPPPTTRPATGAATAPT